MCGETSDVSGKAQQIVPVCSLRDKAPPHMAMTHYTELLESKGLVLARADSISPHLISPAEVCFSLCLLLT